MKKGWQTKALGELCEIELGKTPARANASFWDEKRESGNVWLSIADLLKAEDNVVVDSKEYISDKAATICKLVPKGTLLVSFKLTLGRLAFSGRDLFTNEAIAALTIFNERELSKEFLFYCLTFFDWVKAAENDVKLKGMTLNKAKLKVMPVSFPPLPEQRRIVGILDEAFEAIATAKANAEKNLQNARALFESHLNTVFTQRGEGWTVKPLRAWVDRISTGPFGSLLHKSDYEHGGIPLVNPINIEGDKIVPDERKAIGKNTARRLARYILSENDIVIGRRGEIGRCAVIAPDQAGWLCGTGCFTIRPSSATDPYFLTHLLRSQPYRSQLEAVAGRATMPNISNGDLEELIVALPPVSNQRRLVAEIAALSAETQRLESLYQKKLAALEALKKSLLHQAFTGQLTASNEIVAAAAPIPFPTELSGISTTDLHAGILAMAHQLHEKAGRLEHFGHVKAEKIAHMIEAKLGISLGRNPVKDAAGPNDFGHLKKVEHRAKMTNCYEFRRTDGAAYRVQKLRGFERLIDKTRTALGDRLSEVEKLLRWMLPMNVQQAEIAATVYAAWNNLLLDGKQPTDEEIVNESREDWHPNKLKIPRVKFFSAVKWLREQGVVPEGKGARLCAKAQRK